MNLFKHPDFDSHEQVLHWRDDASGLYAIVAIHNTALGPALGGCRMFPYASESQALTDVLRLSKSMTYTAAMANLPLGGGKAVIIGDPRAHKTDVLLRVFGRYVENLKGLYITAEDLGTTPLDMMIIRQQTSHVAGLPGGDGKGKSGDPASLTAYGVYKGMLAAVKVRLGAHSLRDMKIGIQGAGQVGTALCHYLTQAGAKVYVADTNPDMVKKIVKDYDAIEIGSPEILTAELDVLAPCALGGILNDMNYKLIQAPVIAGAASNQLARLEIGTLLKNRDILYAPDYVINAGRFISIYAETSYYSGEEVLKKVDGIYERLLNVFSLAALQSISTHEAANRIAETHLKKDDFIKTEIKKAV